MLQRLPKLLFLLLLVCLHFISTSQVTQLSNNTSLTHGLIVNGKALLISANDSIWITDGTAGGTKKLTSAVSVIDTGGIALLSNKMFFTGRTAAAGAELWVTDGTSAGTKLIKDIRAGSNSSVPDNFVVFNNKLYFTANDGTHGRELWVSDGTATGTIQLKDIYAGASNGMANSVSFTVNNGNLYFPATDATNGTELWKTNGTATGTVLVKNITAGSASTNFLQFINLGTSIVFATKTVVSGFDQQMQLWKTDGTSAGTIQLKNFGSLSGFFPPSFFAFKSKIYFVGTASTTSGSELWVTDATAAGTKLVKDIYPGTNNSTPFLFDAIIIGSKFYFTATDSHGAELWGSDGTSAGTTLVKDIRSGASGSNPFILKNYSFTGASPDTSLYNGKIFLIANNGTNGQELWITNGTATGTTLVKDIWAGKGSGIPDSAFSYFYTKSGLYFSATDSVKGIEPWTSNGTSTGTKIVADIATGKKNSYPTFVYVYNSQLLLNANNGDNTTGKTDLYKVNATVTALLVQRAPDVLPVTEEPAGVSISPNPVHDQFLLRFGTITGNTTMRLIDNSGRVVLQQNLNVQGGQTKWINTASLPAGVYYLQLLSTGTSKTFPFVKL